MEIQLNISARKSEKAAKIPAFEEIYATDYLQKSIKTLLSDNSRKYPMLASFEDDLRQEMLIYLADALRAYNPNKSHINTFCRKVLTCGLSHARRIYLKDTYRHIYQAVQLEELVDNKPVQKNISTSTIKDIAERFSEYPFEKESFQEEFYSLLAQLSEKDKVIASFIMDGHTFKEIWHSGICSHRYLYDHALPHMRTIFKKFYKSYEKNGTIF